MRTCSVEGCQKPAKTRGWCQMHYMRWWSKGDVGPALPTKEMGSAEAQFWSKVERGKDSECWPWMGSRGLRGYGKAKFKGQWTAPHRFSYELLVGLIPEGFEIDHLCRNTSCVNPAHLEAVTPAENMHRRKEATTHCKRGHEFTPENTKYHSKTGSKVCRTCQRDYQREWMRAYRAKEASG